MRPISQLALLVFAICSSSTSLEDGTAQYKTPMTMSEEQVIENYFLNNPKPPTSYAFGPGAGYKGKLEMYRLDVDLDEDGQDEMLLTMSWELAGGGSRDWKVFHKRGQYYAEVESGIAFRADACYCGALEDLVDFHRNPKLKGKALIALLPAGGGKLGAIAFQLKDGKILKISLRPGDNEPRSEKDDLLLETLRKMQKARVDCTPIEDLRKRFGVPADS